MENEMRKDIDRVKNFGKLGWFTVFQMVYPFENQSYKTAKGEISMPFRTQFGYHILKVNEKREARGEVKLAHIMIRNQYEASVEQVQDAQNKIDSIYEMIKKGENFGTLAENYSQDEGSAKNKGEMNWMASLSGYPEEFKETAFSLKTDELCPLKVLLVGVTQFKNAAKSLFLVNFVNLKLNFKPLANNQL
jgi:peptidyl-prolyl cis-trans isomerase SurA